MSTSYLVYVSQAKQGLDSAALESILAESRANNERNGVTGVLLFVEGRDGRRGSFMQLLEGDPGQLEALRKRIFNDTRHHTKVVLEEGEKPARDFGDWSMAFKAVDPSALAAYPQFADLADPDFVRECNANGAPGALGFLCDFWNALPA